MVELDKSLENLLEEKINLNETRLKSVNDAVRIMNEFIQKRCRSTYAPKTLIPQGSFARKTIIKPMEHNEFDVDLLLPLKEQPGMEPKGYINYIYSLFKSNDRYKDMVSKKKRCITISYQGDFHVDIVPFVYKKGETYITNAETNEWEKHNPKEYNKDFEKTDLESNGYFIKSIKLIKYIKNKDKLEKLSSFILTTLLMNIIMSHDIKYQGSFSRYFTSLCSELSSYLDDYEISLPYISDHEGNDLADRWKLEDFLAFKEKLSSWNKKIQRLDPNTYIEPNDFFEIFKNTSTVSVIKSGYIPYKKLYIGCNASSRDQFFYKLYPNIKISPDQFSVGKIILNGKTSFADHIPKIDANQQGLKFTTNYKDSKYGDQYYWKVRNTGEEIAKNKDTRGEITVRGEEINETCKYPGRHWVEVWIVRHNKIVFYAIQEMIFV